jgi:hypothetical protein
MNIKYSRYGSRIIKILACISSILSLLVITSLISGCTTGSGSTLKSTELNTSTKMSMTYEKFTGYRQTKISVGENNPVTVRVNIVTENGELDAYIAKDNNRESSSYEGNNVPTSSFTVTLSEPGTYTIRVDAKNHSGSYSFTWD